MIKPLLGIIAAASIGALLYAQDAPQPAATFRSEINYVQIPARVLDARGEFVNGLTQSDFQIFEDGQAQAIAAFSAVDIPFVRHDVVYSTNNRADGKARRNEIKVARANVRVVHRTSYLAPSAKAGLLVPPKPGEGGKVSTTPTASSLDDHCRSLQTTHCR